MRRLFVNANLIDVLEKKLISNSSILVEEGKIALDYLTAMYILLQHQSQILL